MVGHWRASAAALFLGVAFFTASERAHACVPATNRTLEVDDDDTGEAPSGIATPSAMVFRGKGAESSGCAQSSTSCDGMGSFTVKFTVATDADSPSGSVGYRVEVIAGTAPGYSAEGFTKEVYVPELDPEDARIGTLYFFWDDGDTDDQEGVDFTITLTPVDANGNEGPTSDPLRIRDEGSSGCSLGERQIEPSWASLAVTLFAVGASIARRRSRRSRDQVTSRIS